MSKRYYVVTTPEYGELVVQRDTIAEARAWARAAFPRQQLPVRPLYRVGGCPDCDGLCCCARSRSRRRPA